eukprot:CAMPEP_0119034894 /NCGR_PEP_ID=MMETSP1177-20130426/1909_1 /TAXON_ID=2985 /ORGANISM="Ochromonas sp, Strain CCMP1899" /LENGTH=416 /DNA_ID=CAMNT_0006992703 /DNA_START=127 /DNA_END=1377 /DNA_ORIENTATION=-
MKKILGLGVACVDIVACIDTYPKQDQKILAKSTGIYSGGNVGNTLTTISLLKAASASIFTKIGDDSNGEFYLKDLRKVGVDVTHVIMNSAAPTLLVYVIVDRQACRTCIASPNEQELTVSEVKNEVNTKTDSITGLLENIELLHLDSRHTSAAVALAEEANKRGIVVSLDVEKDRPHLKELLPLCDIIFTNKEFPENYFHDKLADEYISKGTKEDELLPVLHAMTFLLSCRTNLVVTTRGSRGSVLMRKRNKQNDSGKTTENSVDSIQTEKHENADNIVKEELLIDSPILIKKFVYNSAIHKIFEGDFNPPSETRHEEFDFDIISCGVCPLTADQIVDSTGAGDAYIGGFLTGWAQGFSDENCMKLGTSVAAIKIGHKGARGGLPTPEELNQKLRSLIASSGTSQNGLSQGPVRTA